MKQEISYVIRESVEDPLSGWRLCDELTVVQAALLILEVNPSTFCKNRRTILGTALIEPTAPIVGYEETLSALAHAILAGRLKAKIRTHTRHYGYLEYPKAGEARCARGEEIILNQGPDWSLTTVSVEDLKQWLQGRGVAGGFFFPDRRPTAAEYLDPKNERYAPKLAAGVMAWQAVSKDPSLTNGKSPKKGLEHHLKKNARAYGLLNPDGSLNEQGIEEIAKVANWDPKGGAPKTPGQELTHPFEAAVG